MYRYLFTAQQAEEKFGPDLEFRLSHRALAKKSKREAAAALAAQAAAARLREEELGGVVDPRRPKKQKTIAPDAPAEAEKKSGKSRNARVAIQHDGTDGDAEDTPPAAVKKDKKVKGKAAAECDEPRSYPDSVAWGGEQGVVLDGRIAAAIADMVCDFVVASPALTVNITTVCCCLTFAACRPSPPPYPSRAPSSPAPYATALTSSAVQKLEAAKRWRMLYL